MELIRTEHLNKTYGSGESRVDAVKDVSITVNRGEFVAIMGTSGSGKSTLLHMMAGVERPTAGKVYINGVNIYEMDDDELAIFRRRQIGLIYQFYNLINILNIRENISLPLNLDGREPDENRLLEVIKTLNLDNRIDFFPAQLSGGQKQRVAIGRAVITSPAIILADEPTGNLDSKNSQNVIELFKMVNKKYKQTIVLITHDEEIALQAQRIITIDDGCVVRDEENK